MKKNCQLSAIGCRLLARCPGNLPIAESRLLIADWEKPLNFTAQKNIISMSNLNIISTENASKPNGHYSQAIEANGFIFTSVQLGLAPNEVASVNQQLKNALYNTEQILIAAGSGLDLVVKLTIYLSDISEWATVNTVVAEIFGDHKPARGVVPVKDLHLGSKVAVDVVAVKT